MQVFRLTMQRSVKYTGWCLDVYDITLRPHGYVSLSTTQSVNDVGEQNSLIASQPLQPIGR